MAATAVYVRVSRIPSGGQVDDGYAATNIAATTALFNLNGGKYGVSCKASTYGTVTLQVLAGDGTTMLTALTAFSADGYSTIDLPAGQYKIAVA